MAMAAFNLTLPANANYYRLWDRMQLVTGFVGNDLVYELIMNTSATLLVSDANNANCAGLSIATTGQLVFRATRNSIDLKQIFVSGSGAALSGWIGWV